MCAFHKHTQSGLVVLMLTFQRCRRPKHAHGAHKGLQWGWCFEAPSGGGGVCHVGASMCGLMTSSKSSLKG